MAKAERTVDRKSSTARSDAQKRLDPEFRLERARKAAAATNEKRRIAREQRLATGLWNDLSVSEKRERVMLEQNFCCSMCGIEQVWNGNPLKFEMDHINGDRADEGRDNLRLVCPNCHSQTPTYKNKNAGPTKRYSDDEVVEALLNSESVYKAISKLGMNPHGGNYVRIRRLVRERGLNLPYLLL